MWNTKKTEVTFMRAKSLVYRLDEVRSMSLAASPENGFTGVLFTYIDGTTFRLKTVDEVEAKGILDESWGAMGGKE
jgi:hypothetical protein